MLVLRPVDENELEVVLDGDARNVELDEDVRTIPDEVDKVVILVEVTLVWDSSVVCEVIGLVLVNDVDERDVLVEDRTVFEDDETVLVKDVGNMSVTDVVVEGLFGGLGRSRFKLVPFEVEDIWRLVEDVNERPVVVVDVEELDKRAGEELLVETLELIE